ncbi:MAG: hypothetical protein J6M94_01880 [Prevotella sp.]|nr:hypothetical protein [Prevotella sp.]
MRRVVLLCLTLIVFSTVKAQLNNVIYLGVLTSLHINLSEDAVVDGYLRYTINKPQECIGNGNAFGVNGPGMPCLMNDLGSTVELCFKKNILNMEMPSGSTIWQCDMEFVIDEYNPSSYQNGNNGIEKYYKIILYISRDHGWF